MPASVCWPHLSSVLALGSVSWIVHVRFQERAAARCTTGMGRVSVDWDSKQCGAVQRSPGDTPTGSTEAYVAHVASERAGAGVGWRFLF
jgi:hypothetical protein